MIDILRPIIKDLFDCNIISCQQIGCGFAGGVVYKLNIDKEPYFVAVKTAKNAELLQKEYEYIKYINERVCAKLPKIYYVDKTQTFGYLVMEYFDGVNCSDEYVLKASKKNRMYLAQQIADNLIELHSIKGDKYGLLTNPQYDNWHDYYRPFVDKVVKDAYQLAKQGYITHKIYKTVKLGADKYEEIFSEPISCPTMVHGDYWAQNLIVNKNYQLIGVVDPFNSMWADSEYELFAVNAVYGKKLPVLESYLTKVKVSEKFWLKNSFYWLVSETNWVTILHHDNIRYLNFLVKQFLKQLKIYGLM